jgi:flagellar motor switch protein FliM
MSDTPETEGDDAEDLAAAWGAAVDADAGGEASDPFDDMDMAMESAQPARVLSQVEIDSLMGFDDAPDSGEQQSGIRKVVSAGLVSYERLPMLEIVFDRLVRILSTSLRNLTSDNVEVSIDKIISLRFGDYMNSIPLPAMLSVFKAVEWDNFGLMVIDSSMIYSIVDVLLGGRRGTTPMRIEGRPYTTIERTLVEKMVAQILADLSVSFEPVCNVNFKFDRTEINPRFAAISRPSNAAILVKLRFEMDDRGGFFEIVLPYATLEPVRDLLLQQFMGERLGRDNIWETHLAGELRETDIDLDAVLGEQVMSLADVVALRVGSQIVFPMTADDPVQLRCGPVPLFTGRTGNKRDRIAIQIENQLERGNASAEARSE